MVEPCEDELRQVLLAGADLEHATQKALYFVTTEKDRKFILRSASFEKDRHDAEKARAKALKVYDRALQVYLDCLDLH